MKIKFVIIFFFIISFTEASYSQEKKQHNIRPNTIGISGGSIVALHSGSIYFEHLFFNFSKLSLTGKVGYTKTYFPTDDVTDNMINSQICLITGIKKGHFEICAGMLIIEEGVEDMLFPSLSLGYRWQPPESFFLFRVGVGFPETAFIGVGLAF